MPQAVEALTAAEMDAIDERLKELQIERNGFLILCHQCLHHHDEEREVDVRYASAGGPHPDADPPLLKIDVGWKCGECQTYINNSIRCESEDELEEVQDLMRGDRYDAIKAAAEAAVREERMKALGYKE